MWQVLFYVTPLTVGLALVALLVGAFYLALRELRTPSGLPQGLLAACTVLFLLCLAAPVGQWDRVGTYPRDVDWDPVAGLSGVFTEPGSSDHFSTELSDGRLVHYTPDKLPADRRDQVHDLEGTHFFLHGDPGRVEVLDHAGDTASDRATAFVLFDLGTGIDSADRPAGTDGASGSTSLVLADRLLSLLLFVPVGILAFYSFSQWWARVFFGPALSVGVESIQWAMAAGSIADAGDVAGNTAGSSVGTAVAAISLAGARWVDAGGLDRSPRPVRPGTE